MPNERLNELLSTLPAERAHPDFTRQVLARLDAPRQAETSRRPSLFAPRWVLATAAAAVLALALGALWVHDTKSRRDFQPGEAQAALNQIRADHARLQQELQNLTETAANPDQGVVYLGGNENVDLVVDLGQVRQAPQGVSTASYTNATY